MCRHHRVLKHKKGGRQVCSAYFIAVPRGYFGITKINTGEVELMENIHLQPGRQQTSPTCTHLLLVIAQFFALIPDKELLWIK